LGLIGGNNGLPPLPPPVTSTPVPPPTPTEIPATPPVPTTVTPTAGDLLKNLNEQAIRINRLQKDFALASQTLAELQSGSDDQADRMATIEEAILEDPEKALKVFVLKRDVEELTRDIRDVNSTVGPFFTITITLFGGLLISVTGLVINNFLQQRRGSSSQSTSTPPQPSAPRMTVAQAPHVQQQDEDTPTSEQPPL